MDILILLCFILLLLGITAQQTGGSAPSAVFRSREKIQKDLAITSIVIKYGWLTVNDFIHYFWGLPKPFTVLYINQVARDKSSFWGRFLHLRHLQRLGSAYSCQPKPCGAIWTIRCNESVDNIVEKDSTVVLSQKDGTTVTLRHIGGAAWTSPDGTIIATLTADGREFWPSQDDFNRYNNAGSKVRIHEVSGGFYPGTLQRSENGFAVVPQNRPHPTLVWRSSPVPTKNLSPSFHRIFDAA